MQCIDYNKYQKKGIGRRQGSVLEELHHIRMWEARCVQLDHIHAGLPCVYLNVACERAAKKRVQITYNPANHTIARLILIATKQVAAQSRALFGNVRTIPALTQVEI